LTDWLADNPRDHARCPGLTIHNSDIDVLISNGPPL
jgi:hypothetical protein